MENDSDEKKNGFRKEFKIDNNIIVEEFPVEIEVLNYLVDRDYSVSNNVVKNNHEFDLVVKGNNAYLAIDFDYDLHYITDEYNKLLNINKFKKQNWYFHNISSTLYFKEKQKVYFRLVKKLNEIGIIPKNKQNENNIKNEQVENKRKIVSEKNKTQATEKQVTKLQNTKVEDEVAKFLSDQGYNIMINYKKGDYVYDIVVEDYEKHLAIDFDCNIHHVDGKWWLEEKERELFNRNNWIHYEISVDNFRQNKDEILNSLLEKLSNFNVSSKLQNEKTTKRKKSTTKKHNNNYSKNKHKLRFKRNDIVKNGDSKGKVIAVQEYTLVVKLNRDNIEEWDKENCKVVGKYQPRKRL